MPAAWNHRGHGNEQKHRHGTRSENGQTLLESAGREQRRGHFVRREEHKSDCQAVRTTQTGLARTLAVPRAEIPPPPTKLLALRPSTRVSGSRPRTAGILGVHRSASAGRKGSEGSGGTAGGRQRHREQEQAASEQPSKGMSSRLGTPEAEKLHWAFKTTPGRAALTWD